MDLCRDILLQAEADEERPLPAQWTLQQVLYHIELLVEAGLLDATLSKGHRGQVDGAKINRLTWLGHDCLDAMRDNTVWTKAKETILKKGGSWTFDLLKEALAQIIANQVGLPPR
jgi:hypothetical protein